jgi:hypothetical protein
MLKDRVRLTMTLVGALLLALAAGVIPLPASRDTALGSVAVRDTVRHTTAPLQLPPIKHRTMSSSVAKKKRPPLHHRRTRRPTVTGVAANNSSVRVYYSAVSGARDYRVYDVAAPMSVKYAGLVHLTAPSGQHFVTGPDGVTPVFPYAVSSTGSGPAVYDGPADSIEWNRVEDGQSHTLVVQAVDQLGPMPPSSLYDNSNMPLLPGTAGMGMAQLGANEGMTSDGFNSINGQGPYSNTPTVLATSSAFVVQADASHVPIPSQAGATQTYLDTFTDAEGSTLTQTARNDAAQTMSYRLNSGTAQAATLSYQYADTKDSFPMIESGHFMDVLFDGGTPGTGNPLHQGHSSMLFTPDHPLSLAQGA